jgi:L-serine dehydratase
MLFHAYDLAGNVLLEEIFYSVGGGFIVRDNDFDEPSLVLDKKPLPFAFTTGDELLAICKQHNMRICDVMMANEKIWRSEAEVKQGVLNIWHVMHESIVKGCKTEGILPGGLNVRRRAPDILRKLDASDKPHRSMNWLNAFSIAVNEENAAGGRVVTAPTNGAAGVIPAVMEYYLRWNNQATEDDIIHFLLTSAAMGILFKENASISAAEVGCQGEVGVACSMAAAGYCELLGGTPEQVENAAEIGMEHHLGLTCDPIKGLVQVPCIERNAMGAVQAVNSAELALMGDGTHVVSLDEVIKTMMATGKDMQSKYKETALGGLAVKVSLPSC